MNKKNGKNFGVVKIMVTFAPQSGNKFAIGM